MRSKLSLLLLIVVLSSCGSPTATPTNTPIPPTATAVPTPTQIPFFDFDLEEILIQDNDLPAGYSGGQVSNSLPEMFAGVSKADYKIYQQFQKNNEASGGVTVFLLDDLEELEQVYKTIHAGMSDATPVAGDWDKGEVFLISFGTFKAIDMLFTKCHFVVHIRMGDTDNQRYVTTYAERLAGRLSEIACR